MNLFLVYASTCLAVVSAGISEFGGGGQSNSGGYSSDGGSGGYSAPAIGGGSSGFNFFGNAGGGGSLSNGLGGAMAFGGRGLSFNGNRGATGGQANSQFGGAINNNAPGPQLNQQGGQVRRFVSVHVAPEEPVSTEPRIIQAGGPPDTHYNIIFVKAPSGNNQQKTEVQLPEQPQQKTLVYVLIKKDDNKADVKIRPAPTSKPSKPEVFFIRYKPESDPTQQGAAGAGLGGPAGGNFVGNNAGGFGNGNGLSSTGGSINSAYGPPPPQQSGGGNNGGYQ